MQLKVVVLVVVSRAFAEESGFLAQCHPHPRCVEKMDNVQRGQISSNTFRTKNKGSPGSPGS